MSSLIVTGLLSAIPWKQIFEHGPELLDSAKGLFNKTRERHAQESLEQRVERLERDEKEQARVIEQLVERQELMLAAIQVINARLKALFVCTLATLAGLIACIALLLAR